MKIKRIDLQTETKKSSLMKGLAAFAFSGVAWVASVIVDASQFGQDIRIIANYTLYDPTEYMLNLIRYGNLCSACIYLGASQNKEDMKKIKGSSKSLDKKRINPWRPS